MWTFFEGITFQQPWSSFHGLVPTLKFNKYSRYPKKIFEKKALFQTISFSSHVESFGVPPMLLKHIIHSSYCLLLSYLPRNSGNPKILPRFASGLQNMTDPLCQNRIMKDSASRNFMEDKEFTSTWLSYGIMAIVDLPPRVGWPAIRDNAHQARGLSKLQLSWLHGNLKGPTFPPVFQPSQEKMKGSWVVLKLLRRPRLNSWGEETWHWLGVWGFWGGCWAP